VLDLGLRFCGNASRAAVAARVESALQFLNVETRFLMLAGGSNLGFLSIFVWNHYASCGNCLLGARCC
jgi:hypothetical protein